MDEIDKSFQVDAPKLKADAAAIERFLSDLDGWQKFETIPAEEIAKDKSRLDEFGLSKAKLRVKLLGPDAPPEIIFGGDAALEGRMYVRVVRDPGGSARGEGAGRTRRRLGAQFASRRCARRSRARS